MRLKKVLTRLALLGGVYKSNMFRMEQDESHHPNKPDQDQQYEACQTILDRFKKKVFQTSL